MARMRASLRRRRPATRSAARAGAEAVIESPPGSRRSESRAPRAGPARGTYRLPLDWEPEARRQGCHARRGPPSTTFAGLEWIRAPEKPPAHPGPRGPASRSCRWPSGKPRYRPDRVRYFAATDLVETLYRALPITPSAGSSSTCSGPPLGGGDSLSRWYQTVEGVGLVYPRMRLCAVGRRHGLSVVGIPKVRLPVLIEGVDALDAVRMHSRAPVCLHHDRNSLLNGLPLAHSNGSFDSLYRGG